MSDEMEYGADDVGSLEEVAAPDAVEQAIEFYNLLGPIDREYKQARAERDQILRENGGLTAEQYERWQAAKRARSDFRSAMRLVAQSAGTTNPFAAQAETASVGVQGDDSTAYPTEVI
jgi:hypothetical protein